MGYIVYHLLLKSIEIQNKKTIKFQDTKNT